MISIHTPQGERLITFNFLAPPLIISIHTPQGERLWFLYLKPRQKKFQSTLPKGSDLAKTVVIGKAGISIHTPQGERRARIRLENSRGRISIHTPQGERLFLKTSLPYLVKISIHTPQGERLQLYPIKRLKYTLRLELFTQKIVFTTHFLNPKTISPI